MSTTITVTDTGTDYGSSRQVSGAAAKNWVYDPGTDGDITIASSRTKTGTHLRNYKRRIAKGQNATTTFSGSITSYASIPCIENVYGSTISGSDPAAHRKRATKWSHGIQSIPSLPSAGALTSASSQAAVKFNKQVSEVMTSFQGGVFLAELRETLHMIRHPAQSLRDAVRRYIRTLTLKRKRVMRTPHPNRLRFLSDSWLEYSFGWSPLLNDLDAAGKVLEKRQNQLVQELMPVIGVGRSESTSFSTASETSGVGNVYSQNRQISSSMQIYAGAVSSRASGSKLLTMSALGLSPRSFVPTLWEAMPYSFLIDYFTNVGDVLEAWSNQTVQLAWGRQTQRRSTVVESQGVFGLKDPLLVQVFEHLVISGKTIARNSTVSRGPLTTIPVPALQYELPGFGRKWINLSALATARRSLRFR